jgi:RNA ligase
MNGDETGDSPTVYDVPGGPSAADRATSSTTPGDMTGSGTGSCPGHLTVAELFDPVVLAEMIEKRYVKSVDHPDGGLRILNYTSRTQYDGVWNDVTRTCRGLIVDGSGRVVARPFPKFFNLQEHGADSLPGGPVVVTDKLDGSLAVLYPHLGGHALATRGSFTSWQAQHATELWKRRYAHCFSPQTGWTYLFELITPSNRIVVDYGDLDDLVLLGATETATGRSIPLDEARVGWPGPVVEQLPYRTLQEALAAQPRTGMEGMVVHFTLDDVRVKLKQHEYVALHRIVTGVSERRIWEAMSGGQDLGSWLEGVPDELHDFVSGTADRLRTRHAELDAELTSRYRMIMESLPEGWTRADYANAVLKDGHPQPDALFLLLDGRPYEHLLWRQLRPTEHIPFFNTEDL